MIPKCPKCKKRYVAKEGELCESCSFMPKVGKIIGGLTPRNLPYHDDPGELEDDYGDEAGADSVCHMESEAPLSLRQGQFKERRGKK